MKVPEIPFYSALVYLFIFKNPVVMNNNEKLNVKYDVIRSLIWGEHTAHDFSKAYIVPNFH